MLHSTEISDKILGVSLSAVISVVVWDGHTVMIFYASKFFLQILFPVRYKFVRNTLSCIYILNVAFVYDVSNQSV